MRRAPLLLATLALLASAVPVANANETDDNYASASGTCNPVGQRIGVPLCHVEQNGIMSVQCTGGTCYLTVMQTARGSATAYGVHRFASVVEWEGPFTAGSGLVCYAHEWSWDLGCDRVATFTFPAWTVCDLTMRITTTIEETTAGAYKATTVATWAPC